MYGGCYSGLRIFCADIFAMCSCRNQSLSVIDDKKMEAFQCPVLSSSRTWLFSSVAASRSTRGISVLCALSVTAANIISFDVNVIHRRPSHHRLTEGAEKARLKLGNRTLPSFAGCFTSGRCQLLTATNDVHQGRPGD